MKIFKAISIGMFLMAWFARASQDGKITSDEIIEGVIGAAEAAGIDIDIDVPTFDSETGKVEAL